MEARQPRRARSANRRLAENRFRVRGKLSITRSTGRLERQSNGLLKEFGAGNPAHGSALPTDLKRTPGPAGRSPRRRNQGHAVCVLSRQIAWLHRIDSRWVAANMIPWFQLEDHRHEPAWSGILWNDCQLILPVFSAIKTGFLALPTEMYRWASREETGHYYCWIVAAAPTHRRRGAGAFVQGGTGVFA